MLIEAQQRLLSRVLKVLMASAALILAWQFLVTVTQVPRFIFPAPLEVLKVLVEKPQLLAWHSVVTASEIIAGLVLGTLLGICSAVLLISIRGARSWAMPLMVATQSLPVFALAPLLTLWFGYGMASKIVMATLIIYFPVVAATYDGLRHVNDSMLELARTLNATPRAILMQIRLPAALPSISSGIRVATSVAPIGAVVGEWVGSSQGLGYLMLQANGRMQTEVMFAALLCLCLMATGLYASVNALLDHALYWQRDSSSTHSQQ